MQTQRFNGDMTVGEAVEINPDLARIIARMLQHPRFHGFVQANQSLRELAGRMELGTTELTDYLNDNLGRDRISQ